MKKFSIIIPFYNAEPYIYELLDCLNPQITEDIEVILIDDGSKEPFKSKYPWLKVIRQDNKGLAGARNTGIEKSTGEYLAFIDADDLVATDYVQQVINKIDKEHFNICEVSWKSLPGGVKHDYKLNSVNDCLGNPSACTRVFKRSYIGENRFNEQKRATEDEDFSRKLGYMHIKDKSVITDYMYFYRTTTPNSLSKKYLSGELDVKRIAYYFNSVTPDMDYLIDEIKELDKTNEVFLLTNNNQIPELNRWCQIVKPMVIDAHEARGEKCKFINILPSPIRTQVIVWTKWTMAIGGIETFIYNFCMNFKDKKDIIVLYETMDMNQILRLIPHVRVEKIDYSKKYVCDTLIVNRVLDEIPKCISYGTSVQMVHTCREAYSGKVPDDRDYTVFVSETAKKSFKEKYNNPLVINNVTYVKPVERALTLVSATRLGTNEKGQKRMQCLAEMLNRLKIPYVWHIFCDRNIPMPDNVVFIQPKLDIKPYIKAADYLVQLSDTEAFCYSIAEALEVGTAVLATPLPVLEEVGFKDGENGYTFNFDTAKWTEEQVKRIVQIPQFEFKYDNEKIIQKWEQILGNSKPKHDYHFDSNTVFVKVTYDYFDIGFQKNLKKGETVSMSLERAMIVQNAGYCELIN